MSYKLEKPCTVEQRADFIVEYNHRRGLLLEETENAIYALEVNEKMGATGVPVINPDYEKELAEKESQRVQQLSCTKRNFALILQKLGISYSQLKQLVSTNEQAQLEWDLCVELERSNSLLDVMAAELNIDSDTLDKIFKYANGEIDAFWQESSSEEPEIGTNNTDSGADDND